MSKLSIYQLAYFKCMWSKIKVSSPANSCINGGHKWPPSSLSSKSKLQKPLYEVQWRTSKRCSCSACRSLGIVYMTVFMQGSADGTYSIGCSPAASTYKLSSCFSPLMYIWNKICIGDPSRLLFIFQKINIRELLDLWKHQDSVQKRTNNDTLVAI